MYPDTLKLLACPVCAPKVPLLVESELARALDGELLDGVLTCPTCARWFRVENGIADVVRDGLREVEQDRAFLQRHSAALRPEFLANASTSQPAPPSDADQRIIDEGRHWGRFMRRFWDVGDRSIFDIRCKGSHPPFFLAGVIEPDDRDRHRRWGIFPERTGELLFSRLGRFAGRRGVDVGCGGGQFGLEAANQGVQMIGFDPSFEEVTLAREHARATGVKNIDYLRAEPAHPPFLPGSFHLMMAKDSLHHVPELEAAFDNLLDILREDAVVILHEHVSKPALKGSLLALLMPPAIRKIRSRYPKVTIPDELLRDSANEDVSGDAIAPLLAKHFDPVAQALDLFLANDLEMMTHFAFGKRRWLSRPVYTIGQLLEATFLLLGDRQHLSYVGRRKRPQAPR